MQQLPKGKTLGPNGLPVEFFCIFHDLVIKLLVDIYNIARNEGILPNDFLLGDIILLPKRGDQRYLEKKRPITLLNTKYKIYAKVWQNRLVVVANVMIPWNQATFIKGRSIHHAILMCSEMIHYARMHSIPITFLKID